MNYVLTKGDGTGLDQWMMWDKNTRTMTGLVPIGKYQFLNMKMTGTDKGGLSTSSVFNISFVSKPYLNRALDNYEIRTEQRFRCIIPMTTFVHPNGDQMTITVD